MSKQGREVLLVGDDEHPAKNYDLFHQYAVVVSTQLEGFLKAEHVEPDRLLTTLQAVQRRGDLGVLSLDFILASIDYQAFIALIEDFSELYGWSGIENGCGFSEAKFEESDDVDSDDREKDQK